MVVTRASPPPRVTVLALYKKLVYGVGAGIWDNDGNCWAAYTYERLLTPGSSQPVALVAPLFVFVVER